MASERAVHLELLRIAAVFPREARGREELAAATKVWAEALSDLSDAELRAAVRYCLRTCRFAPTPAEVLAARGVARAEAEAARAAADAAEEAAADATGRAGRLATNPNVLTDEQFARRKAASDLFFRKLREKGIMSSEAGPAGPHGSGREKGMPGARRSSRPGQEGK